LKTFRREVSKVEVGKVRVSKGDRVELVVTGEENVSFGQILKISNPSGSTVYYARVTNASSHSMLEELEELQDLKGSMRTVGPYTQCRLVEAMLFLEKVKDGKLRAPTLNPDYGWPAETLSKGDYGNLQVSGKLRLGYLREGGRGEVREVIVGLDVDFIPRMSAIVGQIGSGKTNAELVLNAELMATKGEAVGLIFDFHGELLTGKNIGKGLADHPLAASRLVYVGLEKPKGEIGFLPLKIGMKGFNPAMLGLLLPDVSRPQIHYAAKLQRTFREDWVKKAVDLYLEGDVDAVKKQGASGSGSVIEALMRKLANLDENVFDLSLQGDVSSPIMDSLRQGKTVLVDVSGLPEEAQRQVVCWIVSRTVAYYRETWRSNYEDWMRLPYLLITLEEAHKFLEERESLFSDIALTHRKYRVGLNAVTPRPSLINRDVFAELWTKLILKTTLREDRKYLADNTPYLEYSDTELKMLDIGEGLLVSQPKIQFAVPVKIFDYREYLEEHLEVEEESESFALKAKMGEVKRSTYEENVL